MPPERRTLTAENWDRVAALMVHRASGYALSGELRPPIVVTLWDAEGVVFQFILPDLTGRVGIGELCPIRPLTRPVYLPVEVRYSDEHSEFEHSFDVPRPATIQ